MPPDVWRPVNTSIAKHKRGDAAPVAGTRDVGEQHDQQCRRCRMKPAEDEVEAIAGSVRHLEQDLRHRLPHRTEHRPRRMETLRERGCDGRRPHRRPRGFQRCRRPGSECGRRSRKPPIANSAAISHAATDGFTAALSTYFASHFSTSSTFPLFHLEEVRHQFPSNLAHVAVVGAARRASQRSLLERNGDEQIDAARRREHEGVIVMSGTANTIRNQPV